MRSYKSCQKQAEDVKGLLRYTRRESANSSSLRPMLLPTVLMGGTLPVLTEYFTRADGAPYLKVGNLYSLNTFGAMAGVAAAGFVLIEQLGLKSTVWCAAAVNLGIGTLLISIVLRQKDA